MIRARSLLPLAAICAASLGAPSGRAGARAAPAAAPERPGAPGVAVATVERAGGAKTLTLPGRVVPDETRVYRVNAGMPGSMRDVSPVVSGSRVRKDQVLGSYHATDHIMVLQTFLMNTHGFDPYDHGGKIAKASEIAVRARGSLYQANLQQRLQELENMGLPAVQRDEIARTGRIPDTVQIVAPAAGVVMERNVTPGLKFDRGFELFRIVDLRRVWVVADVFPEDARHVHGGMPARLSIPEQGLDVPATVAQVLPDVDPETRTTRVRLEVENPDQALLPGMFVDVRVRVSLPPAVVVPADAVVRSGLAETVFVGAAGGALEARRVTTGWRTADRVQILDGLAPGERVAAAGAFVVDSETRLRLAVDAAEEEASGASATAARAAAGTAMAPRVHARTVTAL